MDINMFNGYRVINDILAMHKTQLGLHFDKYYNHACRVYSLAVYNCRPTEDEAMSLAVAAAFHDLGIWTVTTFDYLEPSVLLAEKYLEETGMTEQTALVTDIILNHHKLSAYRENRLAEAFRKADLVDLSLGLIKFNIPASYIRQLKGQFPALGFHRFILKQAANHFARHPLNPLPMIKR
jgi:hypothetical protein